MKRILILCLKVVTLTALAEAKDTFYSEPESKAKVEKEGGQMLGTAKFFDAKWGKGFLAAEVAGVVAFPAENRFTKLEKGTVELFIKMGVGVKDITGELFFGSLTNAVPMPFSTIRWLAGRRHRRYEGKVQSAGMMPIARSSGKKPRSATWQVSRGQMN